MNQAYNASNSMFINAFRGMFRPEKKVSANDAKLEDANNPMSN
jgi:hypothetical protein